MDITDFTDHEEGVIRQASASLKAGVCLALMYQDIFKVVEVHAIGVSRAGKACMRVWQVLGQSEGMDVEGWKMLEIAKVVDCISYDKASEAPRPGYKKGDKGMVIILFQLEEP